MNTSEPRKGNDCRLLKLYLEIYLRRLKPGSFITGCRNIPRRVQLLAVNVVGNMLAMWNYSNLLLSYALIAMLSVFWCHDKNIYLWWAFFIKTVIACDGFSEYVNGAENPLSRWWYIISHFCGRQHHETRMTILHFLALCHHFCLRMSNFLGASIFTVWFSHFALYSCHVKY